MTMLKRLLLLLLPVALLSLAGCRDYESKASYFNGDVAVTYHQTRSRDQNDYISLVFYEKGSYAVTFSTPPGAGTRGADHMPASFKKEIQASPREIVLNQHVMPDFVRITIRRGGVEEFHDFN
jgi:hypothetical protein